MPLQKKENTMQFQKKSTSNFLDFGDSKKFPLDYEIRPAKYFLSLSLSLAHEIVRSSVNSNTNCNHKRRNNKKLLQALSPHLIGTKTWTKVSLAREKEKNRGTRKEFMNGKRPLRGGRKEGLLDRKRATK